ncbi:MAG: hypothetical protein ABI528_04055 [bacterium]
MWNIISGFDTLITEYEYNSQDQVTRYSHLGQGEAKTYRNTYDYSGRLTIVDYFTGAPDAPNPDYTVLDEYDYNENSQVSPERLGGDLKINFEYTNRNWIGTMQNIGGMLEYTNEYYKNGNVKKQVISGDYNNSFTNNSNLNFGYSYDKSNRLLKSEVSGVKSYELNNTYDKDGNLLTLERYGGSNSVEDNFAYSY